MVSAQTAGDDGVVSTAAVVELSRLAVVGPALTAWLGLAGLPATKPRRGCLQHLPNSNQAPHLLL